MRKKFLLFALLFCFIPVVVCASSASVQISASSSAYVGDTVKVSVTLSSSSSIGSWEYNISYDDSKLTYVSTTAESAQHVVGYASSSGKTSVTYSWTFKAKDAGSATFSISGIDLYAFDDDSSMSVTGSTRKTIEIKKPSSASNNGTSKPSTNYNYSSDNNLSSLVVEGFEFEFDKNKTDYSINVPNGTKSVKVGATASDGKAKVNGIGDHELKEGDNLIEVVVTAENGSKKTYNLNVIVAEATPILVSLGDNTYNVVRKADLLPNALATFEASTTLVKGEEVPCYHSSITDYYLIGLRDNDGNIDLYRYDPNDDKFYVYNQLQIGGIYIALLDSDVPNGYILGSVKINEKEYNAFLKDDFYPLLYGINLESGEKNYYSYDESEGTIQKFHFPNNNNYPFIIFALCGLSLLEFFVIVMVVVSKGKRLKKKLHNKPEYEKTFTSKKNSVFKDEDNITDDLTDQFMSGDSRDEEELGHTALISKNVGNVFDNTKNKKDLKREKKALKNNDDDGMFHF